ncbi:phospholipase C type enzyme [Savitreella phatthalungensis]
MDRLGGGTGLGMDGKDVTIVSLNCWGLKYVAQSTDERMSYIADYLRSREPDIVCLQEIWQQRHWRLVAGKLRETHPYAKYFYSGIMGSGLAILSKYPITQTQMRPYTLNGRPQAFWRGDWYVGKGVASAVVDLPDGRQMQLFNTHMHAPYNEKVDTYLCHRISQGWELRKILRASVMAGYITFVTGDFNSVPGSLVHRFLTTDLSDTFLTLNPELPLFPPEANPQAGIKAPTARELVDIYGCTCDVSPLNTWRRLQAPHMRAKRLDYIFHDNQVLPLTCEVILTDPIPGVGCSASDHFGLFCRYRINPMFGGALGSAARLEHASDISSSSTLQVPASSLFPNASAAVPSSATPEKTPRPGLSTRRGTMRSVYRYRPTDERDFEEMEQHISWYVRRERRHSKLRMLHFWCSIACWAGAQCGSFYVRRGWPSFWLHLANAVNLITGLADGMLGSFFGWWELQSLREFSDEVRAARELHARRHLQTKSPGVPLPSELLEPASPLKTLASASVQDLPSGRSPYMNNNGAITSSSHTTFASSSASLAGRRGYRSRAHSGASQRTTASRQSSVIFSDEVHDTRRPLTPQLNTADLAPAHADADDVESILSDDSLSPHQPTDPDHLHDDQDDHLDQEPADEHLEKSSSAGDYLTAKYAPDAPDGTTDHKQSSPSS